MASDEVTVKMGEMRAEMDRGEGRAGDNIRSFMASVRNHNVTLDPTVMVALMSMMVLVASHTSSRDTNFTRPARYDALSRVSCGGRGEGNGGRRRLLLRSGRHARR